MAMITFEAKVLANGHIEIPADLAAELPPGGALQVVLHWAGAEEDVAWRQLCAKSLASAYAPEDEVYEQLLNDPPTR